MRKAAPLSESRSSMEPRWDSGQGPHDFEPEPSAALLAAGREEWLEDLVAIAGRYASPVVPEDDLASGSGHGAFNIDARGAMLGSIVEQIHSDDLENLF